MQWVVFSLAYALHFRIKYLTDQILVRDDILPTCHHLSACYSQIGLGCKIVIQILTKICIYLDFDYSPDS